MPPEERTIQLSTREFLGDRLRPYEPPVDPPSVPGPSLVGRWIAGGTVVDQRPPPHTGGVAWSVVRSIGRGALGEVFEVRSSSRPNRPFALKFPILPLERTAPAIRNEIEKLSRLSFPNLPRIEAHGELQCGDLHGAPYYVTDLLESLDLALPGFAKCRPVDPVATVRIFHALARTLAYLAKEGIVHRDVKPENILIHSGRAILVDWGTARSTSEINELEQNRLAGRLFGTPRWLPPEIVDVLGEGDSAWVTLYPDRISQKTDVYGLGLVVLRLLSGRDLFEEPLGANVLQLFHRFHHLMRNENLLDRYQRQVHQILERNYLGSDPICDARIRDEDLRRLYRRFDQPSTTSLPRPSGRMKRPAEEARDASRMRQSRFSGVDARKTFIDDVLRLASLCLAPYEQRIKAPALLARLEETWPGLPGN